MKTLFRELGWGLLRTRRYARHFRRRLLLESLPRTGGGAGMPAGLRQPLLDAAKDSPHDLLQRLGSQEAGLTPAQAQRIRGQVGANDVGHEAPPPWWVHLWHCYRNPFSLLLTLLAGVSFLTADLKAATVIGAMVLLSTVLRFWQEGKSNRAADALKAMVSHTATVMRRDGDDAPVGRLEEIPSRMLVPGDVIALSAGDMIPADCRVLSAKDLFVSQSAMTGESVPVEKVPHSRAATSNPLELECLVFMGTNVVSGSATAVVVTTGATTYFGSLAQQVTAVEHAPTAFQAGVNKVSWLLIRFMLVMVPLVLLINGFTKGDWLQALLFALSVAVGLTPEMLPMIVTSTLAKGAVFLSRQKVIVKRLDAIQSFGAMDVLCTDKTGTLTQDKIFLTRHLDAWGEVNREVLELAYLNSSQQTGLKNLLDVAVLEHARSHLDLPALESFHKVDEIPFDFERRRMSVVMAHGNTGHVLITKGALEEVLSVCTEVRQGTQTMPLSPALRSQAQEVAEALNAQGLRVVAVATKDISTIQAAYGRADECGLTLVGYLAFLDPPKESTAPALKALAAHGVTVKVLTGDNERVTAKICREVGLEHQGVLLGHEMDRMGETALAQAVAQFNVFAKLTPAHKERIVRALKANGHVVGFMGDGINDAPALHAADIGISVDTAVDIAKEAADIILLEKSLMVLEAGVLEGRRTFANMLKYIKITASSNFGNVFSVLVASAFIPFLPMLPMHLLVQNLLYDLSQTAIPFDRVDDAQLQQPLRWQPEDIGRFMVFFGPISSLFDLITFAMMWFVFGANSAQQQTLFQSGWFVVGLLTQTLIVHMIRSPQIPFFQSRASAPLMFATGLIMVLGVFLPMGPWAHYFKLEPLPPAYFLCLPLILLGYAVVTQGMKSIYRKRWGWQ